MSVVRILGWGLWFLFTFVLPVLVVANVPARLLAQPLRPGVDASGWGLVAFTIVATGLSLVASRWVFHRALRGYRSASS